MNKFLAPHNPEAINFPILQMEALRLGEDEGTCPLGSDANPDSLTPNLILLLMYFSRIVSSWFGPECFLTY